MSQTVLKTSWLWLHPADQNALSLRGLRGHMHPISNMDPKLCFPSLLHPAHPRVSTLGTSDQKYRSREGVTAPRAAWVGILGRCWL
jgi:hypothetical protein